MIRFLHITDFHLNSQNLNDWNNFVKEPMIRRLQGSAEESPFDFVAFTGDMIDVGGKGYGSAAIAFDLFKENVIDPLLESLKLSSNRFFIVPGNHDVVRDNDELRIELGNRAFFNSVPNIGEFMQTALKSNSFSGMERMIEYKNFESKLYQGVDYKSGVFGTAFKFQADGLTIGVSCFNSSWRCYGNEDMGNLIIGEHQLVENANYLNKCDVKIALMHHPLDWLSDVEKNTLSSHIVKDYDILLQGHVHENKTSVHTGFTGTLFTNVAPAGVNEIRSDSRTFANGFTIIDFNPRDKNVSAEYWKYNHNQKEFVLNTDIARNGKFEQDIPDEKSTQKLNLIDTVLKNIKDDHFQEMDNHMMGARAEMSHLSVKEAFIMPPIDDAPSTHYQDQETENTISLSEIAKTKTDLMFLGDQECGKTTLLYRLVREFVDEYVYLRKLPVYINFEELGNKELVTAIREYVRCSSDEVKYLLKQNQIVLLIDNLNYRQNGTSDKINKLHRFYDEYSDLIVIATSENYITGILATDYIEINKIPFKNYFIRNFRYKQIKSIMRQWLPEASELQSEERIEKLVTSFNSYSLPSTAMSVSLFLWSTENHEKKPINHAALLEIYIEIILEKLNKDNIYRDKFDFTNKIQLLAKIAEVMLASPEAGYSLLFSDFEKVIETYLQEVGFDFEADKIVKYFLERKLFVRYQTNKIKFSYSCFFHFFIAKRMEFNPEFYKFVVSEQQYYKFIKEIDFYSALVRSNETLLSVILERVEKRFKSTDHILNQVNLDEYFTPIQEQPEPIAKGVEINTIKENRPSETAIESFYNKRLEDVPDPGQILKKEGEISLEALLIILANVLRNSEGVENRDLKIKAYSTLVKYSLTWMVLYKEYLIDYVLKNNKLPHPFIRHDIRQVLTLLPLYVQQGMYNHAGSAKLASIILEKLKEDNRRNTSSRSEIEYFLSAMLYSDIQGNEFPKHLKRFIKKIKANHVKDFTFYKLLEYYYRRTKVGSSNEETYIELFSILRMGTQRLPVRLKEKVARALQDSKKYFEISNS